MPPRKRATKAISDDFINDDEDDIPQSKRAKTKASEATINTQQQTDEEGNTFWEVCTLANFKRDQAEILL